MVPNWFLDYVEMELQICGWLASGWLAGWLASWLKGHSRRSALPQSQIPAAIKKPDPVAIKKTSRESQFRAKCPGRYKKTDWDFDPRARFSFETSSCI